MSLSKPRGTTSPVQRRFELKLAVGSLTFYDSESKQNVTVVSPVGEWDKDVTYDAKPPFKFIILDVLSVIGGFNEPTESGIWSNEIRSTRDEKFVVRTKKGILHEGYYADIKEAIKADGGKFGNSVYLAYNDGGEWKLGNLKLIGAGVRPFFDFKEGVSFDREPGVAIAGWTALKKGRNEYFEPVFKSWSLSDADLAAAVALDESLQQFLSAPPAASNDEDSTPSGGYSAPPLDEEPPF